MYYFFTKDVGWVPGKVVDPIWCWSEDQNGDPVLSCYIRTADIGSDQHGTIIRTDETKSSSEFV